MRRWLPLLLLPACAEPEPGDAGAESGGMPGWDVPRSCPPPDRQGVDARPDTPGEVVALLNALPKPTSLTCYLEALERPLAAYASTSRASAQPADGPHSPRLFLFEGDFVQTVIATGQGAHLLEMSVYTSERRSVKAEIEFPVETELGPADPYDRIFINAGTSCSVCHLQESLSQWETLTAVYSSEAYRPPPDTEISVSLARQYARDCEGDACPIMQAVFAHGDVASADFPEATTICPVSQG